MGALVDPLAKERTGESWSPHTFHRQRGERAASSPWPRGKTDRGDVSRAWVKERGGCATPQEKKPQPAIPAAHSPLCRPHSGLGDVQGAGLPRVHKSWGEHSHQLLIRQNVGPGR